MMFSRYPAKPVVTYTLLIINCAIFLLQQIIPQLTQWGALEFFYMPTFRYWQFITYMFLHMGISHLFMNMFALWMFGMIVERTMGSQRFLWYYFICGIGAALCQELWQTYQVFYTSMPFVGSTIGASGAVYGVLIAFGVYYPNERVMLLIPPIPLKAKYLVAGYIVIEVISLGGVDNIAHLAHLGGALVGWLLTLYWKRKDSGRKVTFTWRAQNKSAAHSQQASSHRPQQTTNFMKMSAVMQALQEKQKQERINAILDKIHEKGYDCLTQEEKDFLFNNS